MQAIFMLLSMAALAASLAPSLLYFANAIDLAQVKSFTLTGTIAWFLVTPLWMRINAPSPSKRQEEA